MCVGPCMSENIFVLFLHMMDKWLNIEFYIGSNITLRILEYISTILYYLMLI